MNDANKDLLDALYKILGTKPPVDEALPPTEPPRPRADVVMGGGGAEILSGETWIAADKETWRSWTGHRRIWGIEHHGPVYNYLSPEGSLPYTGRRVCTCAECQANVTPTLRDN